MCWSLTASAGFAAFGSVATLAAARAGRPRSHVLMLAYFATIEALQAAQYLVISDCASLANRVRRRVRVSFSFFFRMGPTRTSWIGAW